MLPLVGSLVSSGAGLLGGILGQQNQADINSQNVAMQEQINAQNIANQNALNQQNIAEQEKFAQMGIQWRAADARAAGISPLAALGAQTASFSNNVGSTSTAPKVEASNALGTGIASAGQDISRAISATRSPEEQAVALEKTRQDLESGQLDNELKKAQLSSAVTRLRSGQIGPGIPGRHSASGQPSELQTVRQDDGSIGSFPSRAVEGASWLDPWAKFQYMVRNQIEPAFGWNIPKDQAARGMTNRNPFTGNFYNRHDYEVDSSKWQSYQGPY